MSTMNQIINGNSNNLQSNNIKYRTSNQSIPRFIQVDKIAYALETFVQTSTKIFTQSTTHNPQSSQAFPTDPFEHLQGMFKRSINEYHSIAKEGNNTECVNLNAKI